MATLCLLGEDGAAAKRWEIGAEPVAVGRGETADVKIDDEALSRRHFLIVREGENYLLEDLNSRNGTWVGGRRALAIRLRHLDCISAGRTRFLFREQRAPATPAPLPLTGPHGTVILAAAA